MDVTTDVIRRITAYWKLISHRQLLVGLCYQISVVLHVLTLKVCDLLLYKVRFTSSIIAK
jgi:hypothetical protein